MIEETSGEEVFLDMEEDLTNAQDAVCNNIRDVTSRYGCVEKILKENFNFHQKRCAIFLQTAVSITTPTQVRTFDILHTASSIITPTQVQTFDILHTSSSITTPAQVQTFDILHTSSSITIPTQVRAFDTGPEDEAALLSQCYLLVTNHDDCTILALRCHLRVSHHPHV